MMNKETKRDFKLAIALLIFIIVSTVALRTTIINLADEYNLHHMVDPVLFISDILFVFCIFIGLFVILFFIWIWHFENEEDNKTIQSR